MSEATSGPAPEGQGNAKVIYILYLIGLVVGLTAIVGLVMAYVYRGEGPDWVDAHYRFQIRTFWIGLLYIVVGTALSAVLVGYLILLFWGGLAHRALREGPQGPGGPARARGPGHLAVLKGRRGPAAARRAQRAGKRRGVQFASRPIRP